MSVAGSVSWSVPPADEKFLWKTTSTQTVVSHLVWCVEPRFFSYFLLDRQKDEYVYSFLEVVPRLAILCHLQPVVHLLLRLVAVVAAVVVVVALLLIHLLHRKPQHLILSQCQQQEFHWILYTWVRASWIKFNNCPTRCDLFSLLYFCRQLYMFWV